jgi:glucose/arabinose dehydrogenase
MVVISRSLFLLLAGLLPLQAHAGDCHEGNTIPEIHLQAMAKGLDKPVAISHAGDGSGRLFVLEQEGQLRVIDKGVLQPEPLLDIRAKISSGGERGLLGLAFHPKFKQNGLLYFNYTAKQPNLKSFISEFRFKGATIDAKSERVLLSYDQPWGNHNGGQLAFGPDGYLYIGVGDGGSGNDPQNNGQNLSTLLGSILRINVDHKSDDKEYSIPADNPFINTPNAHPEIYAYGLRNPWRFSFDRQSGQLYAADVGQNEIEEIDIIEKGKNYGWRVMEGPQCTPGVDKKCNIGGYTLPIYSYRHDVGRSITGGYVYRSKAIPGLCGTYLYGDFVNQAIWGLRYRDGEVVQHKTLYNPKSLFSLAIDYFRDDGLLISTFGEGEEGEVYVGAYQSGTIYRIVKP